MESANQNLAVLIVLGQALIEFAKSPPLRRFLHK